MSLYVHHAAQFWGEAGAVEVLADVMPWLPYLYSTMKGKR